MAINICLEVAALQLGEEGLGGMVMVTVGVGIIIQDSNGFEVMCCSRKEHAIWDAMEIETVASVRG